MEKPISVQVCVMAHNLGHEIYSNLVSLNAALGSLNANVYIMANGCRDNTVEESKRYSAEFANFNVVEIELGDKSNAWNAFVYECYDHQSIPVFVDGDLTFSEYAVDKIVNYHLNNPNYNAVSGFPWDGGRSSKAWQQRIEINHEVTGNLYLLAPSFLNRMITKNVRLPVGLIGDDSMMGYLAATDIATPTDVPAERIGVSKEAIFCYPSLNPFSWQDIKLYFRRRIRYSIRRYQQVLIVGNLKRHGINAMPKTAIAAFIQDPTTLKVNTFGLEGVFQYFAVRRLKKQINAYESKHN